MAAGQKIHFIEASLMLLVAGFYDLLSIIPMINFIIWILAWLTFWFWFKMKGISLITDRKKLMTVGGVSLIEIIPALSVLPAWIALVIITLSITKAEQTLLHKDES